MHACTNVHAQLDGGEVGGEGDEFRGMVWVWVWVWGVWEGWISVEKVLWSGL